MRRSLASSLVALILLTGCQATPEHAALSQPALAPPAATPAAAQAQSCRVQVRTPENQDFVATGSTLTLAFRFDQSPDKGAVQQALLGILHPQGAPAPVGGVIGLYWTTEQELQLTINRIQPGSTPWLQITLDKPVACRSQSLLIGEPTTIWRWNYMVGGGISQQAAVNEPVQVLSLDPSGQRMLLGVPMPPDGVAPAPMRLQVLDLRSGGQQAVINGHVQSAWAADGTLWLADRQGGLSRWQNNTLSQVAAGIETLLSPDNQWAAVLQAAHPEADQGGDRTVDLTLVNLKTGKQRAYPHVTHFVAQAWLKAKADEHPQVDAVWAPDSRGLVLEDYPTGQAIAEHKPQAWALTFADNTRRETAGVGRFAPNGDLMFLPGSGLLDWSGQRVLPLTASAVEWAPSGHLLWVPGAGVINPQGEMHWRLDDRDAAVRWLPGDRIWWQGHGLYTSEGQLIAAAKGDLLAVAGDGESLLTTDLGLLRLRGLGGLPQGDFSRPIWGLFGPNDSPLIYATATGQVVARGYDGHQFGALAETVLPDGMGQVAQALVAGGQLLLVTGGPSASAGQ